MDMTQFSLYFFCLLAVFAVCGTANNIHRRNHELEVLKEGFIEVPITYEVYDEESGMTVKKTDLVWRKAESDES